MSALQKQARAADRREPGSHSDRTPEQKAVNVRVNYAENERTADSGRTLNMRDSWALQGNEDQ